MARKGGLKDYVGRLGARILSLKKKGSAVPDSLAAAARRAIQGSASEADKDALQAYLGEGRSGAGALRGFEKSVNRIATPIANISRDVELLQSAQESGRGVAMAEARLVQTTTKNLEKLFKAPAMKSGLEKAAIALGRDPKVATMFLNSVTRGLRLGGAIGSALSFGAGVMAELYEGNAKFFQTMGHLKDLNRQLGGDPRAARAREEAVRSSVTAGTLFAPASPASNDDPALVALIKNYAQGKMEEEIIDRVKALDQSRQAARKSLGAFGVDSSAAIAAYALSKGKSVMDLTGQEKTQAIDTVLDQALGGREDNGTLSSMIKSKEARFFEGSPAARLRASTDPLYLNSLRQKFAEEGRIAIRLTGAQRAMEREATAQQMRRDMDPIDLYNERMALETAQANWGAYRNRRTGWANDFY